VRRCKFPWWIAIIPCVETWGEKDGHEMKKRVGSRLRTSWHALSLSGKLYESLFLTGCKLMWAQVTGPPLGPGHALVPFMLRIQRRAIDSTSFWQLKHQMAQVLSELKLQRNIWGGDLYILFSTNKYTYIAKNLRFCLHPLLYWLHRICPRRFTRHLEMHHRQLVTDPASAYSWWDWIRYCISLCLPSPRRKRSEGAIKLKGRSKMGSH
jgi:hypothetical protein